MMDEIEAKLRALDGFPASAAWPLAHCAQSIEYSIGGFPSLKPWPIRVVGRMVMRRFLRQGFMKHDRSAPVPGAPGLEGLDVDTARARLFEAIARFRAASSTAPHFAYGPVDKETYARLHAMHIEDHLAAFAPG